MARILFLDDDAGFLEVQAEFLRSMGHEVFTSSNGRNCRELIEFRKAELLITDLIMPEKEGLETIREVREKFPTLKIIAISGGGRVVSRDFLEVARKMGANDVLEKPFRLAVFKGVIERVLNS